ncbi:MAG: peptidoglycan editing factor PgeF [Bacillota bacterium]
MRAINKLVEVNGLQYYNFKPLLEFKNLVHAFSTRKAGTSIPPYDTLNLGLHVGDERDNVVKNRKKFFAALGFSLNEGVSVNQVHGNHVKTVEVTDKGRGIMTIENTLCSADALVTNKPGILLTTYYADCVSVFIYDQKTNSIGLAHAGWKGTLLKIASATVKKLQHVYQTNPKDCIAVIGPSIGPCCYEVDNRVLESMKKAYAEWPEYMWSFNESIIKLNLWELNKMSLQESGLKEQNIYISGLCTHCLDNLFFSHRRDNGKTGRMAAVFGIRG